MIAESQVTPLMPVTDYLGIALRLLLAWGLGYAIATIYRAARRESTASASFPATLVLLSILIALVTQVIGDNLARAFGLVGALSIVRFRTVVEDTYDIAYVIFAVVIGMAAGASSVAVTAMGTVIVGIAAWLVKPNSSGNRTRAALSSLSESLLRIRVAATVSVESVDAMFNDWFAQCALQSVETGRGGAAMDLVYRVRLKENVNPLEIVQALQRFNGVQSVELKRIDA